MDIYPAYEDFCYRLESDSGKLSEISKIDPMTGKALSNSTEPLTSVIISPAKHNITSSPAFSQAEAQIRHDLAIESAALRKAGKELEAHRLTQKVNYDLEIIKEVGYVNGIENYSRYFDGRKPGDPPYSLLDYFQKAYGENFLVCIDESHMTVPQIRGMYNGDHSRKQTLIDFGFRLRSAFDNRPSTFDEFYPKAPHIVYVSATPNEWEMEMAATNSKFEILNSKKEENEHWKLEIGNSTPGVVEQLIRPTGIVDPQIIIRPAVGEIPDIIMEIEKRATIHERVLVTTLTKKTAEDLTEYVKEKGVKAAYLHSDIHTLERSDVLDNLRNNTFDVLIGVNLLREGLDLPEVTLVAILDADKEGFLRSRTSLIQTMGRAARNVRGEVIMYADVVTKSMKAAISEIDRRRTYQEEYNKEHGITPETIQKAIRERIVEKTENPADLIDADHKRDTAFNYEFLQGISPDSLTPYDRAKLLKKLEREMKRRAEMMDFEAAIAIRDKVKILKK
jgi:excinuclease ABC subunit B